MTEENGNGTNGTLASNREAMDRFIDRLSKTGNVSLACKASGVPRRTVYRWREKWQTFADEWEDALNEALDMLEGIAWQRATVNSDRLLMFLLEAHRPHLYKNRVEVTGKDGGPIVVVNWEDGDDTD